MSTQPLKDAGGQQIAKHKAVVLMCHLSVRQKHICLEIDYSAELVLAKGSGIGHLRAAVSASSVVVSVSLLWQNRLKSKRSS